MSAHEEIELSLLNGNKVHFLCYASANPSNDDFEFDARCHFIPRIGEKVIFRKKVMRVLQVFSRAVENDENVKMTVTVACRYQGDLDSNTNLSMSRFLNGT